MKLVEIGKRIRGMKSADLAPLVLMLAAWTGCGGAGYVPVEGTITLDGQPLAGATVTLQRAEGPTQERIFVGETDSSGHYQMTTIDGGATGVPPGDYQLMITTVKPPPDANELTKLPPERVPQRWRSGTETVHVPEGGTTDANFDMKSR